MTPRLRRWIMVGVRLVIAAVFISASIDKIIHPDRFADIVWDYQLLPMSLANLFAVCLPWIELALGLLLVVGCWVPSASLVAFGLTAMFMAALGLALASGTAELHCGCFSTSGEGGKEEAWGLLARDALLLVGCAWLFVTSWAVEQSPSSPQRSG